MKQKLLLIFSLFFALNITAQTVHVVTNHADDNTEGTLRKIITDASPGDTIRFSETDFIQDINDSIVLNSMLSINKSLYIEGLVDINGVPFITIRVPITAKEAEENSSTASDYSVLRIDARGHIVISNLELKGGRVVGYGGVVYVKTGYDRDRAILNNLHISEGQSTYSGGGVYAEAFAGSINLTNNIIFQNSVHSHGGGVCINAGESIFNNYGTVILDNNIIHSNKGTYSSGGGISGGGTGHIELLNNTIHSNEAEYVGGVSIGVSGSTLREGFALLENNNVHSNKASGVALYADVSINRGKIIASKNKIHSNDGEGISADASGSLFNGGYIELTDNEIYNNKGQLGGGISATALAVANAKTGGFINIQNNIIHSNTASLTGGGLDVRLENYGQKEQSGGTICVANNIIYNNYGKTGGACYIAYGDGSLYFTNNTIYNNDAITGSGIYAHLYEEDSLKEGIFIQNSILWGNSRSEDLVTNTTEYASAISVLNSCINPSLPSGIIQQNNINANPLFVNEEEHNFQLQAASPCINKGNNDYVRTETDLAGNTRIFNKATGGIVDIGAYEFSTANSALNNINQLKLKIYPNPAIEYFIANGFEGEVTLNIININGEIILAKQVTPGEIISTQVLPQGMYLVQVNNEVAKLLIK